MKQNWQYKKLGEVCEIERGGSPRPINEYLTDSPDGLNWIKIGDAIEGNKYISRTKEKIKKEGLRKTRYVHKGDFILSNSMSFGKPYILEIDGCIHDGWLVIHDTNNTFNKSFLYFLLGNPNMYKEFQRLAVGGVVNNLNSQLVRNIIVPVPPLSEQERIVGELDLLSGIIEKQKQQLQELATLAQSIFYSMFGDPISNEKGWEVKKLYEISEIGSGGTPSKSVKEYWENGTIPWIGSNMCQNIIINKTDGKYITEDGLRHSSAKILPLNSVLVALVGATIGKVGLLKTTCCTNQNIAFIKPTEKFNSYFLFYVIISLYPLFQDLGGDKFKMANLTFIRNLPIILPPIDLQNEFAEKIEKIEKQKEAINKSIKETQKLFDYTMDKYFG